MEDSAPSHRLLEGGGGNPRHVGGVSKKGVVEGRGYRASALLLALIHRSAWKVNSPKFDAPNKANWHPACIGRVGSPISEALRKGARALCRQSTRKSSSVQEKVPTSPSWT